MKDKADDSLAPPAALSLPLPGDSTKYIKRKKPHTLPPLEKFRNLEGRGSPIPQVRRRSSIEEQLLQEDGQVIPPDGRPLIRLTRCPEERTPGPGPGVSSQPQLSPMSSRYTPLQPIRRNSNRDGTQENGNNPTGTL